MVDIDLANNLLLVRGAVPGHREALVEINASAKHKADRAVTGRLEEAPEEKKKIIGFKSDYTDLLNSVDNLKNELTKECR